MAPAAWLVIAALSLSPRQGNINGGHGFGVLSHKGGAGIQQIASPLSECLA